MIQSHRMRCERSRVRSCDRSRAIPLVIINLCTTASGRLCDLYLATENEYVVWKQHTNNNKRDVRIESYDCFQLLLEVKLMEHVVWVKAISWSER